MRAPPVYHTPPAGQNPPPTRPPPRRPFTVSWPAGAASFRCVFRVEASIPAEAAEEALLHCYGPMRPAEAPSRVDVEGVVYAVDEWHEARVWLYPEASPSAQRLARTERGLAFVRLARQALGTTTASYDLEPIERRLADTVATLRAHERPEGGP
jgi:hypothetical protein